MTPRTAPESERGRGRNVDRDRNTVLVPQPPLARREDWQPMADELDVRRADRGDLDGILALARAALGWTDSDSSFLEWKHLENPFGASPMWDATDDERVVGFRTFVRWEFLRPDGHVVRAARAVDTATDPAYQGRGIFTRLTLEGLEHLPSDGVQLIFNTPNAKSLAGYLK